MNIKHQQQTSAEYTIPRGRVFIGHMDEAAQHRYCVTLWPQRIEACDVEEHADKGALPTLQFKAPNADAAARTARMVSGQHVLRVERVRGDDVQGAPL